MSSLASSASSFSSPVLVVCMVVCVPVDALVVLTTDAVLDGSEEVIWARPTPAAAAKASPAITPTRERRLSRLSRFCTLKSLRVCGSWLTVGSRRRAPKLAQRHPSSETLSGVNQGGHDGIRAVPRAGSRAERRDANLRADDRLADRGSGGDRLVRAAHVARAECAGQGDHGERSVGGVQALRDGPRVSAATSAAVARRAEAHPVHRRRHRRGGRGRGAGGRPELIIRAAGRITQRPRGTAYGCVGVW